MAFRDIIRSRITVPKVATVLGLVAILFASSVAWSAEPPNLTSAERAWLESHPIRLGPAPNYPPLEFFDDEGQYVGVVADYASLIEEQLGVEFTVVREENWSDVVAATRQGEIDVWLEAADTPERREFMLFTEPYLHVPCVIIVRREQTESLTLADLSGLRVAAGAGYAVTDYIREQQPTIDVVEVESVADGLQQLSFGGVDAVVASSGAASFYIEELGLSNLRVAGDSGWAWHLSIGVRSELPELHSALSKAVDGITDDERRAIYRRWITFESTEPTGISPWVSWLLVGGLMLLVGVLVTRQSSSQRVEIRGRSASAWPVYVAIGLIAVSVMLVTAWAERMITDRMRSDTLSALDTVLQTTSHSVHAWLEEREIEAQTWADHLGTQRACQALTVGAGDAEYVATTQANLATQMDPVVEKRGLLAYALVGPDSRILASGADGLVGRSFDGAFSGDVLRGATLDLPRRGVVPTVPGLPADQPMMAVRATVQADDGLSCVLALLIDPEQQFSRNLQRGRLGESGESYAFNEAGLMLSQSRFEQDLRRIGLLAADESGVLNIALRDPGGSLLHGQPVATDTQALPLTRMAASAVGGGRGSDLVGYRDYRGVPVLGTWVWDPGRGLGIATEIDVSEAYDSLHWVQRGVRLGGLSVLGMLVLLLSMFRIDEVRRRRMQVVLAAAERRSRLLLESAGEGIFGVTLDGRVNFINPSALRMLGFASDEILQSEVHALIHHSHLDGSVYPLEECPTHLASVTGRPGTRADEVLWRKDGTCFPVEYDAHPVLIDGTVAGSVVVFRDISERREAERRMIRQTTALEATVDAVVITDPDAVVLWVNNAFTTLTGYAAGDAVGHKTRMLKSGTHPAAFYEEMWATIMAGGVWTGELTNRRKDGSLYPEEMSITPVTNDAGEIVNYVAVKRDITERKRVEAILEKGRQRMEEELNIAREIQMSMVPMLFPAYPRRHEFSVFATLKPAREVGGDFYDFLMVDDDHFCMTVGDVSGKGVPAALFMAVTKTLINSLARTHASPSEILTKLNNEISLNNEACMFVTVFIAILNVQTGKMVYANAGHNPPYLLREAGEVQALNQRHGPVIGAMEGLDFGQDDVTLVPGDIFLVYTDGVTEAMSPTRELYTEGRLERLLANGANHRPEPLIDAIVEDVHRFEDGASQADDITLLACEFYSRQASSTLEFSVAAEIGVVGELCGEFSAWATAQNVADKPRQQVLAALDELLNNTINYGYPDGVSGHIYVRMELWDEKRLVVVLRDDARPFDPRQLPADVSDLPIEERQLGGVGLLLVQKMMDHVDHVWEDGHNMTTLVKTLR